ncbi:MAG: MFS transporter [Gammaproteobacteria bacterium]|nr:MFS transporter [Gammaproteobacteria bacterium]
MAGIGSLLLIKPGEGRQVSHFVLLLICLGAGMAIGRGSADVLFLKRYGIEYLPVMYLLLSVVLAISFTLYAAFVDRISSEQFFYFLLSVEVLVLLAFWYAIAFTEIRSVYPAYYIFYELVSELILVHASFYISQSLDTMQSKRLTSLILAGYQLGMITGGLFFAMVMPMIGVEHAMTVWSGLLLISLSMLFSWHRRHGVSPFFKTPSRARGNRVVAAIQEVKKGVVFVRQSPLLMNASFALFFMVLMFYVLTYSVNKIYSESFTSEAGLAMFFGMLVAGTNLLAVVLQAFVSGRVIEAIGVRKAKLIYPVLTLLSYILLLLSPGFYTALVASVNNSTMMPAFRNPSRQMFFNVLPDYIKGRARATSVALVLPAALFIGGALIMYLQTTENPSLIIYLGFACAVMYSLFCFRMGKVYSKTLIENLKQKLYLPENISKAAYRGNNETLFSELLKGLASEDKWVCLSYAELLIKSFPEESVLPIMLRIESAPPTIADHLIRLVAGAGNKFIVSDLMLIAEKGDDHLKSTIYDVVLEYAEHDYPGLIETCLSAEHSRVRVPGIKAAVRKGHGELFQRGMEAWYELLHGDWAQQMSVIEMYPLMEHLSETKKREVKAVYERVFAALLTGEGDARRVVIYRAISHWQGLQSEALSGLIINDMRSVEPELRAAATNCLPVLPDEQDRKKYIWMMLADGHASVRKSALSVLQSMYQSLEQVCLEWLMTEAVGSPRAQKVLLQSLIELGIERACLQQVVDKKAVYATELLAAINAFDSGGEVAMVMMRTVLEERLTEMIDLILLAAEPMVAEGSIAVIRAGLSSKDASSVADAHEALQSIDDKELAVLLSDMIDRRYDRAARRGYRKDFADRKAVLQWCVDSGDAWMQECGHYAMNATDKGVYA